MVVAAVAANLVLATDCLALDDFTVGLVETAFIIVIDAVVAVCRCGWCDVVLGIVVIIDSKGVSIAAKFVVAAIGGRLIVVTVVGFVIEAERNRVVTATTNVVVATEGGITVVGCRNVDVVIDYA